jgi:hypothetical protein
MPSRPSFSARPTERDVQEAVEVERADWPNVAAEAEREAKSMHPASGLALVPVLMSAPTLPAVPMMPMVSMMQGAVAVSEQPVQPVCLRHRLPACAIRGS